MAADPSTTRLLRSELWRRPYASSMWPDVGENCTYRPGITMSVLMRMQLHIETEICFLSSSGLAALDLSFDN